MNIGRAVDIARRDLGLSVVEVWLRYFGMGGTATPTEVERFSSPLDLHRRQDVSVTVDDPPLVILQSIHLRRP